MILPVMGPQGLLALHLRLMEMPPLGAATWGRYFTSDGVTGIN